MAVEPELIVRLSGYLDSSRPAPYERMSPERKYFLNRCTELFNEGFTLHEVLNVLSWAGNAVSLDDRQNVLVQDLKEIYLISHINRSILEHQKKSRNKNRPIPHQKVFRKLVEKFQKDGYTIEQITATIKKLTGMLWMNTQGSLPFRRQS